MIFVVHFGLPPEPAYRLPPAPQEPPPTPNAPCHGCRHFRGFSRIAGPDPETGTPIGSCAPLKRTPADVVRGERPCDHFEAGEHWEYT